VNAWSPILPFVYERWGQLLCNKNRLRCNCLNYDRISEPSLNDVSGAQFNASANAIGEVTCESGPLVLR
jgi:hypothetical protein